LSKEEMCGEEEGYSCLFSLPFPLAILQFAELTG
jgi:hypothetical protein